jgi:aryl-alcohol dehydrogenase-like predicted oxidoreductase
VEAGFVTFDLADHYGPAEDIVGAYRRQAAAARAAGSTEGQRLVSFHTKWVPSPGEMPEPVVAKALDVSRERMGYLDPPTPLDLVAFHWWECTLSTRDTITTY